MARKDYTPEQAIGMLREAEVRLSQGEKIGKICRALGISEQSYYRWRRRQGASSDDAAVQVRELAVEVKRLKQLVADVMLENQMLREVAPKKW